MTLMAKLILVKHAPPQIDPEVPSPRWVLSPVGRDRCEWLATEFEAQGVTRIYSSLEPKALETAALAATRLGLEVHPRRDLHENDRTGLGFGAPDEFRQRMRRFFEAPSELVVGVETAGAALERFEAAITALASEAREQTLAVVTHGTVLTLLVAKHNPIAPFDFWDFLTLPSYVVLEGSGFRFDGTVHHGPAGGV
jgi:broad specificity phosphatase PhoE